MNTEEWPKFTFTLSIGYPTATRTETKSLTDLGYSAEEWIALSESERENILEEAVEDWAAGYIEATWY